MHEKAIRLETQLLVLFAASSYAKKDNGVICYIRRSTFHVTIEETNNGEMAYILNEDHIKPESVEKLKQNISNATSFYDIIYW